MVKKKKIRKNVINIIILLLVFFYGRATDDKYWHNDLPKHTFE